jgi:hypothetical protein
VTKIGMIFECGPEGADLKVCTHLVARISPGVVVVPATLTNKKMMIADCGMMAAGLLHTDGCVHVLIVWDLFPPWRDQKPCRHEDRQNIFASLDAAGVPREQVSLVCISEELEAWLLADEEALRAFLSTKTHQAKYIPQIKKPERVRNPKERLHRIFRANKRGQYNELEHALGIAREWPNLDRLRRRCETFQRFEQKLLAAVRGRRTRTRR